MKWEMGVPRVTPLTCLDWHCTDVSGEGAVSHGTVHGMTYHPGFQDQEGGPETITGRTCHVQALLEYSSPPSIE